MTAFTGVFNEKSRGVSPRLTRIEKVAKIYVSNFLSVCLSLPLPDGKRCNVRAFPH